MSNDAQWENEGLVKVRFRLTRDEDGWPPADSEGLWALPVGKGAYRLDNIPFFVRGVSCDDIVAADAVDGVLWFREVMQHSGQSTLRVLFHDAEPVAGVRQVLRDLGADSEGAHIPTLIAVNVPAEALDAVRKYLDAGEERGDWEYEEGCVS
jgi:hypothetical protein